eukprot:tig00021012_g17010.t1
MTVYSTPISRKQDAPSAASAGSRGSNSIAKDSRSDLGEAGPVHFYNRGEPYYEFTNFYEEAPFSLDDKRWRTSEHYFQAQKFVKKNPRLAAAIRDCWTPREALEKARQPWTQEHMDKDWDGRRDAVMLAALRAKFQQNERIRKKLLGTGDRVLVERTALDSYWGDGPTGLGQNRLGVLLMQVRDELKKTSTPSGSK